MRKLILPLMISLVILCGCSDNGEESFLKFMQQVYTADQVSFNAVVRAEYSDKTAAFKLGYLQDENGAVVEILEPELVAGIKARVSKDSTQLEYENVILDIGTLFYSRFHELIVDAHRDIGSGNFAFCHLGINKGF